MFIRGEKRFSNEEPFCTPLISSDNQFFIHHHPLISHFLTLSMCMFLQNGNNRYLDNKVPWLCPPVLLLAGVSNRQQKVKGIDSWKDWIKPEEQQPFKLPCVSPGAFPPLTGTAEPQVLQCPTHALNTQVTSCYEHWAANGASQELFHVQFHRHQHHPRAGLSTIWNP